MPPKKAAGSAKNISAKKPKLELKAEAQAEPKDSARSLANQLQSEVKTCKTLGTKKIPKDSLCKELDATVYEDYGCMLNQTNIGANNNKFYVIQLLCDGSKYSVFTRWGRVGEPGQQSTSCHCDLEDAIKSFEKKFKDKTGNEWNKRDAFVQKAGKYTLLEMDNVEEPESKDAVDSHIVKLEPSHSVLDSTSQELVRLIFDKDMFNATLESFELDTKKMPLGKISKGQIAKGFEVLDELEKEVRQKRPNNNKLVELSSRFYTVIPHNFGRKVPPVVKDIDTVNNKKEMLTVLEDIVVAQEMDQEQSSKTTQKNELDEKYKLLNATLEPISRDDREFKVISTYFKNTMGYNAQELKIRNLWKLTRSSEEARFKPFGNYVNRKLLWHGTSVAVAAAILKDGLRIMPHSGGRVGKGIYFASQSGKSLGYMRFVQLEKKSKTEVGVMFLNEVAMGDWYRLYRDGVIAHSQEAPPDRKQSSWAVGITEPDISVSETLTFPEGRQVQVSQGRIIPQPQDSSASTSSFSESEYVVYNEGQVRMRYVLLIERL